MTGEDRAKLTYVTDLDSTPAGGGAYAVNWHAFNELQKQFDTVYAGPIVPRPPFLESAVSRLNRRILKRPGNYSYFSESTLERNAALVARHIAPDSKAIVFRSAARWARCNTSLPYFVYLDAVTHTFFHNTFDEADFKQADLRRIWNAEAEFLERASGVFFESEWGMRTAIEAYGLEATHYTVASRGGVIEPPDSDTWDGESLALITMAMDFRQKGGDLVAEAFAVLKPRYPSLQWRIVGGQPPTSVAAMSGVTCEGVLRPDKPGDLARLTDLLSNAFLCVHPTREDTSPLVITEAAYFGCPSVSVNMFAIPELIVDGKTGTLLAPAPDAGTLARAIENLLNDRGRYVAMRKAAREYSATRFRWERVGEAICSRIRQVIAA